MTARELKDRLYSRHPASSEQMPGPWTVVEEFRAIDLLAISAWSSAGRYARVGYEVKVSRSDYRRELLRPGKRERNVAWCNEFYFAVPSDLLTAEELAWKPPPEFDDPASYERTRCRYAVGGADDPGYGDRGELGRCRKGKRERWIVEEIAGAARGFRSLREEEPCTVCGGKGYEQLSLAEREGPQLWVPSDVGLVVVDGCGCRVRVPSPKRATVDPLDRAELGQLVRWVSMRPDPRHHPERVVLEALSG